MTMESGKHMREQQGRTQQGHQPASASGGDRSGTASDGCAPAIALRGVTKDYGHNRGIFDITLDVEPGTTMGFLGANGAGKTVTMRTLMGFIKPGAGTASIAGLDCFRDRARIQEQLGYLPGEVTCPEDMRGRDFLAYVASMKGVGRRSGSGSSDAERKRVNDLIERFELDPSARIGQMSKGTKQKVAIVAAFMGSPRVLLLDEPTSGLDPVMQDRFVELVAAERKRGATILLSSHMFAEVERTCDRVAFIRAGHLRGVRSMSELRAGRKHAFDVTFADAGEAARYRAAAHDGCSLLAASNGTAHGDNSPALTVEAAGSVDAFIKDLASYRVANLVSREQTLEELFRHIYEDIPNPDNADGTGAPRRTPNSAAADSEVRA